MSKYTTELRFICETNAGLTESKGYNSINDILESCRENIFNFDFPIFDEAYRPVIEKKILKHYYTREIATETVGLWKHYLDMRLNEIMPYYNKLYETELYHFNPFYDVDLFTESNKKGLHTGNESGTSNSTTTANSTTTETGTENGIGSKATETFGTGSEDNITNEKGAIYREATDYGVESVKGNETVHQTGSGSSNTTKDSTSTDSGSDTTSTENANKNTRYDLYSDTPQGSLTGVENENYLTNARKIIDDGTGSSGSSTTDYGKTNNTNEESKTTTNYTDDTATNRTEDSTSTLTRHSSDVINNDKSHKTTLSNNTLGSEHSTAQKEHNVTNETTSEGTEDNTTNKNSTLNTTEDYIKHVYGKTPGFSYSKLLQEFRETFLNIDMLIIDELSDLFFGLW